MSDTIPNLLNIFFRASRLIAKSFSFSADLQNSDPINMQRRALGRWAIGKNLSMGQNLMGTDLGKMRPHFKRLFRVGLRGFDPLPTAKNLIELRSTVLKELGKTAFSWTAPCSISQRPLMSNDGSLLTRLEVRKPRLGPKCCPKKSRQ